MAASEPVAKRRLLFIGGSSEPGGLHIQTAEVAAALAEAGHDVAVLNLSTDYFSQLLGGSRVRVLSVLPPGGQPAHLRLAAWRRMLAPFAGWEVILARGSADDTPLALLLAIGTRARRIFTIEHRPYEAPERQSFARQLLRRLATGRIHRAIAVSEEVRDSMIEQVKFPPCRLVTCLNWTNAPAHQAAGRARGPMRRAFKLDEQTTAIGYLGRLAPEKRVEILIEAFASLCNDTRGQTVRLVLIGDGWRREMLERQVAALGVADQVFFAGWQANAAEAMAAIDIFVLPSLIEGFPLSLLEAMAAARICLAHAMHSATIALQDGKTGLIGDFTTAAGLEKTLRRALMLSFADRQAMGEAAAKSVVARFARHERLPAVLTALEAPDAATIVSSANWRGLPGVLSFAT